MFRTGLLCKIGRAASRRQSQTQPWIDSNLQRSLSSAGPTRQFAGGLTEEQEEFKQVANAFARKELLPYSAKWDSTKHFPVDTLRAAAQLGFGGIFVGEDVGRSWLYQLHLCLSSITFYTM